MFQCGLNSLFHDYHSRILEAVKVSKKCYVLCFFLFYLIFSHPSEE